MGYVLIEVDVHGPLPAVQVGTHQSGLGVLVRRAGRPVDFLLLDADPGTCISPERLDALIGSASAEALVREAVLDELGRHSEDSSHTFSVVVCTRDRPELLRRCLTSVLASVEASGADRPQIVVVDNAPPDPRTRETVAALPYVDYVLEPRAGLDFARNAAVRAAAGDVVVFLDDDVVVDSRWYAELRAVWALHPDAGGATGQVLPLELETAAQVAFERYGGFRRPWQAARYQGQKLAGNRLFPYGAGMFGAGCNMSFRRSALLDVGGFDEALDTGRPLPGGGDLDMFSRILRAGYPLVYSPYYLVHHQHRRTDEELRRQLFTWGTGHMAFVEKTWRADPAGRPQLAALVRWQLTRLARDVARAALKRTDIAVQLPLAELRGSLLGLTGSYGRSVARTDAIRTAAAG